MFEEVCGNKLQLGGSEEDLWVEKILTFAQQQPDSAPSSRYQAVPVSWCCHQKMFLFHRFFFSFFSFFSELC